MAALLLGGAACATGNGVDDGTDDPTADAGFDKKDTGEVADAGFGEDTGKAPDAGESADTGETADAGARDAGARDAGVDAGARDVPTADVGFDSGARDVPAADVGFDVGPRDAGMPDVGTPDVGRPDAGTPDAGTPDAGTPDAGTPDAGTPDVPPACVPRTEVVNGRDDDCDGLVDEGFSNNRPQLSLACTGTGLVRSYGDRDVDDGGDTSGGDGLEFYCHNGFYRFCLSGEACPWRGTPPAVDDGRSCSNAGLNPSHRNGPYFMAYLTNVYFVFDGIPIDIFYCPADGRVSFDTTY